MSTLPEQFSEARKAQVEAQVNFFHTFTGKAFESVEKIIALNIETSRASLEKSSALVRQMIAVKDPRDLLTFTNQNQSQFENALAYGRQLFGIAAGMAAIVPKVAVPMMSLVPPSPVASAAAPIEQQPVVMPRPELVVVDQPQADLLAVPTPIAEPTPIAKATGLADTMPKPAAASFPVPSSSKPIAVTQVKPVEAEPPPAPVSGTPEIVAKKAEAPASKPARKK
jgi:phasin family protein